MLRDSLITVLRESIDTGVIGRRDVLRTVCDTFYSPAWVRLDLGRWLVQTGVVTSTEERGLSGCPFTEQQLREADQRNEIPVVVPRVVTRERLAQAFGLRHWAVCDPRVVTADICPGDAWLLVSAESGLVGLDESCLQTVEKAAGAGLDGLSMEEYIVFAYRFRYFTGAFPDADAWTWLPWSTYESSLVVCASFPGSEELFLNLWPWSEFQSNVGLRPARRTEPASRRAPHTAAGRASSVK